jgi:hypothetical protein
MAKREKRVFRSVEEFEAEYFPRSFEEKSKKETTDPKSIGIDLAKESLEKIKSQLVASSSY